MGPFVSPPGGTIARPASARPIIFLSPARGRGQERGLQAMRGEEMRRGARQILRGKSGDRCARPWRDPGLLAVLPLVRHARCAQPNVGSVGGVTSGMAKAEVQSLSAFIWSVADLLRGDYKQSEYGKVILPFTVLRRLDCVLEPTKPAVLAELAKREKAEVNPEPFLLAQVRPALLQHLAARHEEADGRPGPHRREPARLHAGVLAGRARHLRALRVPHPDRPARQGGLLYLVTEKFANIDLHPDVVSNAADGRRLRGADPQVRRAVQRDRRRALHPARSHPPDGQPALHRGRRRADQARRRPHASTTRPPAPAACCRVADEHLAEHEPGRPARHVRAGAERRVLRDLQGRHADQGPGHRQHRLRQHALRTTACRASTSTTCSPIRRSAWSGRRSRRRSARKPSSRASTAASAPACRASATARCCSCCTCLQDAARRGRRQPLRHRPQRLAAVHRRRGLGRERDPPLRAGERPGRGHRRPADRHVLQHRHLHLRLDRQQPQARRSARARCSSSTPAASGRRCARASAASARSSAPSTSTRSPASSATSRKSTQRRRADQPHLQERGLRLPHHHRRAPAARRRRARSCSAPRARPKGKPQPDADLRDTENVPLSEDVDAYFKREVLPHAPDAWIDHEKTKVGYEIPFNRHFYVFKPPRPLAEIDAELKVVTDRILTMIGGLTHEPQAGPSTRRFRRDRGADRVREGAGGPGGQYRPHRSLLAGRRHHQPQDRGGGMGRRRGATSWPTISPERSRACAVSPVPISSGCGNSTRRGGTTN